MELGDIINFLLVIAFAIVAPIIGAVSKRNKSKQQAGKATTGAYEDFARDIEETSEQEEMETTEHSVMDSHDLQTEESGRAYQNHSNVTDFRHAGNKLAEYDNKSATPDDSKNQSQVAKKEMLKQIRKQDNPAEAARIARGFNIRKAVIFSEILNTKYF